MSTNEYAKQSWFAAWSALQLSFCKRLQLILVSFKLQVTNQNILPGHIHAAAREPFYPMEHCMRHVYRACMEHSSHIMLAAG